MVYAGAPIYMWRFAILAAVFVNNLAATYYSTEKVWATPFEVIFGEPAVSGYLDMYCYAVRVCSIDITQI